MIVELTFPAGITTVRYGQSSLSPDGSQKLDLPDYVAVSLLTLSGVTGPTITGSVASLLAADDADWEANYMFWAYGQQAPATGKVAAAGALLTAKGTPAVSMA